MPAGASISFEPETIDFEPEYETKLTPEEEANFTWWKSAYAPGDSGEDYDFRGAFRAGVTPDPETGHWPDTFKKPNHPTFSDQSIYAKEHPELAGHWEGDQYQPPAIQFEPDQAPAPARSIDYSKYAPETLSPEEEAAAVKALGRAHPDLEHAAEAVTEFAGEMVPRDPYQALLATHLLPALNFQDLVRRTLAGEATWQETPILGRIPELLAAKGTPQGSKERTLAELHLLADIGLLTGFRGIGAPRIRGLVRTATIEGPRMGESLGDELRRLAKEDPEAFRRRYEEELAKRIQPEGGETGAETIRSDQGQAGEGSQAGEPPVQGGPAVSGPDLQRETPAQPGGPQEPIAFEPEEPAAPAPAPEVQTPGSLAITHLEERIKAREEMLGLLPANADERRTIVLEIQQLQQELHNARFQEEERQRIERSWQTISQGSRMRIQGDLRARGFTDEEIEGMDVYQARDILAKPPGAPEPAPEPEPPQPGPAEPATEEPIEFVPESELEKAPKSEQELEEERLRREHEQEMEGTLRGPATPQDYELLESIRDLGGLPGKGGLHRPAWKGELQRIQDLATQARKMGIKLPKNLFRTQAPDVDRLVLGLQSQGFTVERPQDLFDILEKRIIGNVPHYATPDAMDTGLEHSRVEERPQSAEEEHAHKLFAAGEPSRLQTTSELLRDLQALGPDPEGEALLRQPRYWIVAESDSVDAVFSSKTEALEHMATMATPGAYLVERTRGKPDRVIKHRPYRLQSDEEQDKYLPKFAKLTGEPLRLALERGRAAELRWKRGETPAGAPAPAEEAPVPGEEEAPPEYGSVSLNAISREMFGRPFKELNPDQQDQVRYQEYVEGQREFDLSRVGEGPGGEEGQLELAPPESDQEMLERQAKEKEGNAALEAERERQGKLKAGWSQKLAGDTGDLGQGDLLGKTEPELFDFSNLETRAAAAEAGIDNNYPALTEYPDEAPPGFSIDDYTGQVYAFSDAARESFKHTKGDTSPGLERLEKFYRSRPGYGNVRLRRVRFDLSRGRAGGRDHTGSPAARTVAKIEALIRANGGEPVWYRNSGRHIGTIGSHIRGTNEVLLNVDMAAFEPVTDIAAHEFAHYLRSSAPDLWNQIANHIKANPRHVRQILYNARLAELGYKEEKYLDEQVSDVVKDALRNPGRFARATSDTLFNRILEKLHEWWKRILKHLERFMTKRQLRTSGQREARERFEDVTSDLKATRDKVMQTLAEWQERRRQVTPGQVAPKETATGTLYQAPDLYFAKVQPHRGPTAPGFGGAPAPSSPAIAAAAPALRTWWKQKTLGFRKVFAPQTIDKAALMTANAIRHYNARSAQVESRADAQMEKARADFDRTPVPRGWKYQPGQPLPRNYAFIDFSERGLPGRTPQDRQLQATIKQIFKQAIDEVHRVDPNALQKLIQDYFPHLWKDPKAAQRVFAEILSHRPLEGSKGFLKQRTLEYFRDGLEAGLEPVSDNPVDLVLTKLHEINRFVAGKDIMAEMKRLGARRFVYAFERPPEGWRQVDDPTSTVYGPPFVTVPEAYDEQMKVKTVELLNKLGINHERVARLRGQRWGEYHPGSLGAKGPIKTRFAGPLSVYWHELGHALQERYGWVDQIAHDAARANLGGKSPIEKELRDLADLRAGGPPVKGAKPTHFRRYVRTKDEKAAVMLEAYLHAPDAMKNVAPTIYARVRKFIKDHPELEDLERIRPDLVLGSNAKEIPVNGMVILGHWYSPEGAAQVVDNYLSPGLQRFGLIRAVRTGSNILNQLQLGFSAFHAGFTTIEQAVSTMAAGINELGRGRLLAAGKKFIEAPIAPVSKYYTGKAVQTAMVDPAWAGKVKVLGKTFQTSPEFTRQVDAIADLAVKAGLRATTDPFWKTQVTRNFKRAWYTGGIQRWAGTPLRLPFVISEQLMRPILEYLVPRQKLGAFAELAEFYMEKLGPNAKLEDVRAAMARAADAVEDRMGQMTYDNLFYNRVMRDLALLGFRAYGWQLGKYRAMAGAARDTLTTIGRVKAGGELITPRMAYPVALLLVAAAMGSVMNYLMTGEGPQDWKDALMPRTGRLGPGGEQQRLSLPTYLKDLLSDWHDFPKLKKMLQSVGHKLNPWIGNVLDLINNQDFWGTKIADERDPWIKQWGDRALFVLKSALPFSVTGLQRLREAHPTLMQQLGPFFGFVPAKRELTMSPAQIRAAELYRDTFSQGGRRQEQTDHSRLISGLMRDMKEQDPEWQNELQEAIRAGALHKGEMRQMFGRLPLTPMMYQVKKLDAVGAMEVWDLASPEEQQALRPILIRKIWSSKTLPIQEKIRMNHVLQGGQGSAAPAPAIATAA